MNPYRFSPIQSREVMIEAIHHIHMTCHTLCKQSIGRYLPVAGNVGVFCHYDDEYTFLTKLREELTNSTDSVYGKYYKLHEPIIVPAQDDIPKTTYSFLYIRNPDPNKHQVGDIDFYLEPIKYAELKQSLLDGKEIKSARILPSRPDLDLIELYDSEVDAFGYIGNKKWH
ncbi:hypothetical protein HY409_01825 [Candidatus Gottesmanbacteria bacterium]|nr:hypothetical protein [Candidatus Gottesmanbacteria bacterium]